MSKEPIRCLEFFSGIGGLHYALKIANINAEVVAAFDVNLIANKVYKHNFEITPVTKPIDRLTINEIEAYNADCWLLSPPCQPYTSGGLRKDIDDPRAKPLLHLIDLLPTSSTLPKYLFLENVKNFETSQTRCKLVNQLEELGYQISENLLTPTQFGIPNNRVRYYLVARRNEETRTDADHLVSFRKKMNTTWPPFTDQVEAGIPPLSCFLEDFSNRKEEIEKLLVPEQYILRLYKFRLDIVRPTDKLTSCITKAYGSHHIQTSGSLVQTKQLENTQYDWDDMPSLLSFGLRFLSPTEISRLHAFPMPKYQLDSFISEGNSVQHFSPPHCLPHLVFPQDIKQMQQYRLLGNSLNCWVVAELYRCILFTV
ncbi:MAG: S-adenosyl-L-methionine-dependent methyltransferase [Benjaminiella poitrasii]|nr:MAG: S-adenosyl-L-methionine-dependent methyltransferase [Benjaminiella poitrasii]